MLKWISKELFVTSVCRTYSNMKSIKSIFSEHNVNYFVSIRRTVLFLVPYVPYEYPEDCYSVDGYYSVSNKAYHATNAIIAELNSLGIEAERYRGNNLRSLSIESKLASPTESGFVATRSYGTYVFIGAFASDVNVEPSIPEPASCQGCGRCALACPTAAINSNSKICIRAIQNAIGKGLSKEQEIYLDKLGSRLLGCDACQRACPLNANISPSAPPDCLSMLLKKDYIEAALSDKRCLERLSGEIGANIAVRNKLITIVDALKKQ